MYYGSYTRAAEEAAKGGRIILIIFIIIGIAWCIFWGCVTQKVIENKGYSQNWFWWGFLFGLIAFAVAVAQEDCRYTEGWRPSESNQSRTPDREVLKNGGWLCEKCGRTNPAYTGTCACGNQKPSK